MAKSSGPWYANLKTNQIVALVAAGIVVTLIVLQVFGFDLWSRFGKSDNFIPSFIDGGGDTDPASLLNVDEELVGNLSESIVAEQPVSYMSPEEITHGDMLLGILAEGYVMAAEEIASSRLETMMNRVMVSGTALPPGQFVNTLDDKLAYAIMKDLGGEASEDATKAAVKKAAKILGDPKLISELPADSVLKQYLVSEAGEEVSEKAFKRIGKNTQKMLLEFGGMKSTSLTGAIGNLAWDAGKTIAVMIAQRKLVGFAQKKAFLIAQKKAMMAAGKRLISMLVKKQFMMAAKFMMSMAMGPIGWALEAVGLIGTLIDLWDPNNENDRLDPKDYNDEVEYLECRAALVAKTNGRPWPPVAQVQKFFPEEYEQAYDDVYFTYQQRAVAHILDNPDQDVGLTAIVMQMTFGIPDRVLEEQILKKVKEVDVPELEHQHAKLSALILEMMRQSPQYRDATMYGHLVRHITENSNRDFENAKAAPFWYFAMSIPTAAYTGAISTEDIPAAKRGITYSNLTIYDIKVTPEREEFGRKCIDIYRAKVPYAEERVRAYEIKEEDIMDDLETALIPEMPDIDEVKERTAEYFRYKRKGIGDNMISQMITKKMGPPTEMSKKKFGFRDEGNVTGGRAKNGAHSNWLAMCCFQQFLLQLAQHPGVNVNIGDAAAAYNEGETSVKLFGVFKWKEKYYRAFAPRPWHEPRFVSLDLRYCNQTETSIFLNKAAARRWNEVFEHQRTAGNVLYQFRGIPPDRVPNAPVAIWSRNYPDVSVGNEVSDDEHPTPLKTRIIKNLTNFERVYKQDGRIYFKKWVDARVVKIMSESDYNKITNNLKDKSKGWGEFLQTESFDPTPVDYETAADTLEAKKFYKIKLAGRQYIFYNGNTTGVNPWLKKAEAVIKKKSDVKEFPAISGITFGIKLYIKGEFKHHLKNRPNGTLLEDDDEGMFDAEVEINEKTYHDLVWVNIIGPPDPKVYKNPDGTPRDIPHIKVGEYTNDLRVGIYKLSVTSYDQKNYGEEEICHFVNYDGNVNPKWEPVAHEGTISEPRMFFLGINRLYQWCTKGMENDDSMMLHAKDGHGRMDTYDDAHISKYYKNKNQDRMIYEVYRVQTKSGVPHAIMNRGSKPYIGFNDWYEESSFTDANYVRHAWQTFHEDTRRCFVKNEDAAKHFCKKYKGENWVRKNTQTDPRDGHSMYQGECRLPRWSLLFSFILGENLIRMANRV
ncbi:hypothetical protein EhV443 [Emiliania huxleyi virus 86]|uniref:Putative membrane protein n=2 Tax=Emiliania huxleyi virus 86 TaxID=181082 RepID=Q4A236_EHV8U|nr:hypothetical protein EhV443 [Emiliania huxleyi virus 86]AEO97983.1 hypothetical protein ENVG_00086 [Emiliania huxleyi virus 84]UKZ11471.1 hypothetical protein EhVM1_000456 [Emiliania huxleyi virus M1]CAI65870.1 putative membrane protein [Emiliania huxleyi virus 86]